MINSGFSRFLLLDYFDRNICFILAVSALTFGTAFYIYVLTSVRTWLFRHTLGASIPDSNTS